MFNQLLKISVEYTMNQHVGNRGENCLCFQHILGHCPHMGRGYCNFVHVNGSDLPNDIVNDLCRLVAPGVDSVMGDWNNNNRGDGRGGRHDVRQRRWQDNTPRAGHGGGWQMGGTDQMVGTGIVREIRERARMMTRETRMIIDNKNNNDYLRNNIQEKLKGKFHQQQWGIASEPILDGSQGKRVFDSTQRYRRRRQTARKVKEV